MQIISLVCRYFLCLIPYLILVSNMGIIYHITGPITIPPFQQQQGPLIYWIGAIEFIRVFFQPILKILQRFTSLGKTKSLQQQYPFVESMCFKYGVVLLMKLFLIFHEIHRLKYYLHVFFLELFIMAVNVLADVVQNSKVSLVMDIVLIDSLNRVAIFYELTRTFNPNFGLYFFGNNLITLISYMLEGDKKTVLYVRHDVYRIMIVTMTYLFLFSLFQCSLTYRPLIVFLLTAYFFYHAIHQFAQESTGLSKNNPRQNVSNPKIPRLYKSSKRLLGSFDVRDKVKEYIERMRKNKALLYFTLLIVITILIEFWFIEKEEVSSISQTKNEETVLDMFQSSLKQYNSAFMGTNVSLLR